MDEELARRRSLTFKQAEGIEPLPRQLQRTEISQKLRALIYNLIHRIWNENSDHIGYIYRESGFYRFLRDNHIHDNHGYESDFDEDRQWSIVSWNIRQGDYIEFYETVQQICRHDGISYDLSDRVADALIEARSPFRLIDNTLIPFSSEIESASYANATAAVSSEPAVQKHLRSAASALSKGEWADSVRESMHAVESMARQLTGADSLSAALNNLSRKQHIHNAMNEGFKRLYGYTSDQNGIRHPLLEDGDAKVTEADAMFMLGACASFVSYLATNGRKAGLLDE